MSPIRADVIPFALAHGESLIGPNVVGLRRRGVTRAEMHRLRRAYRALFAGEGAFADRIDAVAREFADEPMVKKIIAFIRADRKRPLMRPRARRAGDDAA
jgi:UDP-N-acetylglucosamine acyltransferase